MAKGSDVRGWAAFLLGLLGTGVAIGLLTRLFPAASAGDRLTAVSALLGGVIGAAGAAFAVYLTLGAQRRDEAQKVEAALRIEVAEFGRRTGAALVLCEMVLNEGYKIPLRDLRSLMAMPDATVFKATADRISRLSYGPLFVVLHARVTEALQMVEIYASANTPQPFAVSERLLQAHEAMEAYRVLDREKAKTLAIAWFDACEICRSILIRDPNASELAESLVREVLRDLDGVHTRIPPLLAK